MRADPRLWPQLSLTSLALRAALSPVSCRAWPCVGCAPARQTAARRFELRKSTLILVRGWRRDDASLSRTASSLISSLTSTATRLGGAPAVGGKWTYSPRDHPRAGGGNGGSAGTLSLGCA